MGRSLRGKEGVVLTVSSKEAYLQDLLALLQEHKGQQVCVVTLNRGAAAIQKQLRNAKVETGKVFFVDGVTPGLASSGNVVYTATPGSLTSLGISISALLKQQRFDLVVFDSLSSLSYKHRDLPTLQRFTFATMEKMRKQVPLAVFTCLAHDAESPLIQNAHMQVDEVVQWQAFRLGSSEWLSDSVPKFLGVGSAVTLSFFGLLLLFTGDKSRATSFFLYPIAEASILSVVLAVGLIVLLTWGIYRYLVRR